MNPVELKVPIYKGAQFQHLLRFFQRGTSNRVDLTGLGPFTFTVSHPRNDEELVTFSVAETDLENGELTVTGTPAQTDLLPTGFVRIGMRDVLGNPYIHGRIPVLYFPPPPP